MKKMILSALMICALTMAPGLYAQQNNDQEKATRPNREQRGEMQFDKMATELQLTDAQKEKMKATQEKYMAEAKRLRQEMQKAGEEKEAELKKILTPEQYEKYSKMSQHKSMKNKRQMHKRTMKKNFDCNKDSAACVHHKK